jgi:hypothetical protein
MKLILRLAVVVAILLMVNNVAFAAPNCTGDQVVCYAITETYPDESTYNYTYKFCLNNDGTGNVCFIGLDCADFLKVFGGGTGWYNFDGAPQHGGDPNWSIWVTFMTGGSFTGIYQPIGEGNLLTGVEMWSGNGAARGIVSGIRVPCP